MLRVALYLIDYLYVHYEEYKGTVDNNLTTYHCFWLFK